MRKLTQFEDRKASLQFSAFLLSQSIENLDPHSSGEIWIVDESHMIQASKFLDEFVANRHDPKFKITAKALDSDPPQQKEKLAKKIESQWKPRKQSRLYNKYQETNPVVLGCIILSVLMTYGTEISSYRWLREKLYFSQYYGAHFPEILSGEVWRLVTPIFMHGNFLHILFNMMWLWQLGRQVERFEGSVRLFTLTIGLAIICNTGQYLVSGPNFIGYSGVVYGLLGYIWMMSRQTRSSPYFLDDSTVGFMVVWLLVCLVGIIPGVANTQHVLGFVSGIGWGWTRAKLFG